MTEKQDKTPEDDMAAELMLKEADEALRQEELKKIWEEWGATIIGVALMVVFGTMIGTGWTSWRQSVHENQTAILLSTQNGGLQGILSGDNADLSGHYKAIAKMMTASQLANAGGASSITSTTIHNLMVDVTEQGLPHYYDMLAKWAKLRTAFDATKDDDKKKIANDLEDLANTRKNPFEISMMVEAALMHASLQNYDRVISILEGLDQEDLVSIPELKNQVASYIAAYSAKKEDK